MSILSELGTYLKDNRAVKEFASSGSFPATGKVNTVYIDKSTDKVYYWDGSAYTGIDAETFDGLNSTQFVRSDANDTITGQITLDNATQSKLEFAFGSSGKHSFTKDGEYLRLRTDDGSVIQEWRNNTLGSKEVLINGSKVWTAGNDGSGSGLDADLLDGLDSSSFVQKINLPYFALGSGGITDEYLVLCRYNDGTSNPTLLNGDIIFQRGNTSSGNNTFRTYINVQDAYTSTVYYGYRYDAGSEWNYFSILEISGIQYIALKARTSGGNAIYAHYFEGLYLNHINDTNILTNVRASDANVTVITENTRAIGKFWTSDNDGSGSGLDADTLDGVHLTDLDSKYVDVSGDTMTGSLQATVLKASEVSNVVPTQDDTMISGYGVSGNRITNPIYVHNNGNGGVRISSNGTLGVANGMLVKDTGVDIASNLTVGGIIYGPTTMVIDPAPVDDIAGTLVVKGNLQIDGTTTTINSTTVDVQDKNIVLAKGSTNKSAADGAGISIDLGSDGFANFEYDSGSDDFVSNKALTINAAESNVLTLNNSANNVAQISSTNTYLTLNSGAYIQIGKPLINVPGIWLNKNSGFRTLEKDGTWVDLFKLDTTDNTLKLGTLGSVSTGGDLALYSNGAEKVRVTDSGNVGIGTTAPDSKIDINGDMGIDTQSDGTTNSETPVATIATFDGTVFKTGKFLIQVSDGTDTQMTELLVAHNGTTAMSTEYGVVYTNTLFAGFDVEYSSGTINIIATATTTSELTYTVSKQMIKG